MPTASVFLDDVSSIDSGNARVTVRHTANAPAVDVLAGGTVLLPNLANGGGAGADVPTGQYGVTLNAAGTSTQAYPATGAVDVDLAEGANTVVYAVGTLGGDFKLLVDVVDGLGEAGAFGDIANSVHKSNISLIARVGVTKGKTATTYGPNDPVTRGQMAAFIQRALGLPSSAVDAFTDDDGSIFENDINAIAAFGITKGKTATTFGPNDTVTRGQMAAFITRAFNLTPADRHRLRTFRTACLLQILQRSTTPELPRVRQQRRSPRTIRLLVGRWRAFSLALSESVADNQPQRD